MRFRIYQIDLSRAARHMAFVDLETVLSCHDSGVDSGIYDCIYDGIADLHDLEDVYALFNSRPAGFTGHSLSVSDVVEIITADEIVPGFYYCDSIGFKRITFDSSKTRDRVHKETEEQA